MTRVSPIRRHWASVLAALLSPANPSVAAEPLVKLLPFLDDFPDAAFTAESAKAVAQADRYGPVPDYGAIAKALRNWWRDNRPHPVALPAPAPPSDWKPPTEAEQVAVALQLRQFRAAVEAERMPATATPVQSRHLSPNDLAAVYRHEAENNPDARIRACATTRLAMLEGQPPARAVTP